MTDLDASQYPSFLANFDWALNEQCYEYSECDVYTAAGSFLPPGKAVLDVEYNVAPTCSQADTAHLNAQKQRPRISWRRDRAGTSTRPASSTRRRPGRSGPPRRRVVIVLGLDPRRSSRALTDARGAVRGRIPGRVDRLSAGVLGRRPVRRRELGLGQRRSHLRRLPASFAAVGRSSGSRASVDRTIALTRSGTPKLASARGSPVRMFVTSWKTSGLFGHGERPAIVSKSVTPTL